ncbi:IgGFc-binding protein-like isoform X2 [Pseudophryne corroboree]|uniref:IgGFc-binding protein-like isoform X2 n=1 Tax=Pseudophryne corroboree TaxID=495146 RepID=UPI0030812E9E
MLLQGQTQRTYITAFMENSEVSTNTTFQLYLVTYNKTASVTVTVSNPHFSKTVFIERESSALVDLDYTYMITESQETSKAVLVTSDVDISVFAFYTHRVTADAMACLSLEDLGTEYYISTTGQRTGNQFAVANSLEEVVSVTVTVSGSITFKGISYSIGDSFSFQLEYQQVVQFKSADDLTGTRVSSTAPVAVFSGNKCFTGISNTCDSLTEQLHPVKNWGSFFAVFPLLNHNKDVIKIISTSSDTTVDINGPKGDTHHSLQKGSYIEITVDKGMTIKSTKPIMVTYIFQDFIPGVVTMYDPFITNVPPSLVTRLYYRFVTQARYYNFLLIVSQASASDGFYLDHRQISSYSVSLKSFSGFHAWEVSLGKTDGQHEIYHESMPFTIYVFGIENYVSYGYSMGQEAIYAAPTEDHKPEGTLSCLSHVAEYHLPLSLVTEANLDASDIHLEDPLCKAELKGDVTLIKIPFSRCGSDVLIEDGKTYYVNTIYGTIPETRVHRIEIPVRCEIETNETLGFHFHPKVTDVVYKSHYNVSLKLYQNSDFTNLITRYPYAVDIHGHLHVEFRVDSGETGIQILAENCRASPSLEDTERTYNLIQHGCSSDSTLQTHPVSDHRLQRFSVHVFRFYDFQEVYLTCNVIICHNETSPNHCTQGCNMRRHRRDTHSSDRQRNSARLSQGPILFKSGQIQADHTVPSSVLVAVVGVMGFLSVLGLVIQKHHYRRNKYVLLGNGNGNHQQ